MGASRERLAYILLVILPLHEMHADETWFATPERVISYWTQSNLLLDVYDDSDMIRVLMGLYSISRLDVRKCRLMVLPGSV